MKNIKEESTKNNEEVFIKAKIVEKIFDEPDSIKPKFYKVCVPEDNARVYVNGVYPVCEMTPGEAWKICLDIVNKKFSIQELKMMFDTSDIKQIIQSNTPYEAKEKIEKLQLLHEVEVGDIVENSINEKGVVTKIKPDQNSVLVLWWYGGGNYISKYDIYKTNRRINVQEFLKQINE